MEEAVDGEYQNFKAKGGAYTREHFFGKYPECLELVANLSDDEIALLNRGGHDSTKVWNAYAAAVAHKGRPTVILAKTVKGYGMGKAGEALNVTHQQKKMDDEALKAFRDRFNIPVTDEEIARAAVLPARRGQRGDAVPQEPPQGARRLTAGAAHDGAAARGAGARGLQEPARRQRGSRDLDHDGLRPDPDAAPQGQEHRRARRADRAGRGAHLRHGGPVPPGRHLLVGRPALHAAGRRPAHVLPRGQEGPDPRGGHQRGRRLLFVDGGGDGLREPRNQHDSDVHLLFDVRLPAHRRLRLGGGRHAGARLPARRDRGTHDARGRGPAAPGRPQPPARLHDPELRRLRPVLRLRARRDHAGRPAPHVCGAGKRLLLHHLHERELRASRDAEGRRAGDPARHVPPAHRRARRRARDAARLRHHPARDARGGGIARVRVRHPGGRHERHELLGAAARRARRRARGDAESRRQAAPSLGAGMPRGPAGPVHRRDRLHEDGRRPDPPVGARPLRRARHRRLRPQRLARSRCAGISRWTATGSWWPRSRRSPTTAASTARASRLRSRSSASTRASPIRW